MSSVKTTPLDIFFCSIGGRELLTRECHAQWALIVEDAEFHYIMPTSIHVDAAQFQKQRRVYADEKASGEFYIVTDDDCLPPSMNWLTSALEVMERHPEFAILSLWPENATIQRWTPEDYKPFEDSEVMEHVSVGGIRVCRKGILKTWPALEGKAYDMAQCQAIREAGYRCGYFKNIRMQHLGEGRTTLL